MLSGQQHIRHGGGTPCGSICAGLKPNSLHARRKAAALALESGGFCHWRLDRVSSAKAFAPADNHASATARRISHSILFLCQHGTRRHMVIQWQAISEVHHAYKGVHESSACLWRLR